MSDRRRDLIKKLTRSHSVNAHEFHRLARLMRGHRISNELRQALLSNHRKLVTIQRRSG